MFDLCNSCAQLNFCAQKRKSDSPSTDYTERFTLMVWHSRNNSTLSPDLNYFEIKAL